jgi:hypothetical protein
MPRVVRDRAAELAARVGELALLGERKPQAIPCLRIGRRFRERELELHGGLHRAPRPEQGQAQVAAIAGTVRAQGDRALEVGDGQIDLAAITEQRAPLSVAEGAAGSTARLRFQISSASRQIGSCSRVRTASTRSHAKLARTRAIRTGFPTRGLSATEATAAPSNRARPRQAR